MRSRSLPMFTAAEEEAFQAARNSRRLNTMEFQAGLAETQPLSINSEFLSQQTDTAPVAITPPPPRSQVQLKLGRFVKPLILIAVSAAVTMILMSGHENEIKSQLASSSNSSAAHEILVSAADPELAGLPAAHEPQPETVNQPGDIMEPVNAERLQPIVTEREFSYASQPRASSQSSFISVPLEQSASGSTRSELAALGLRPIPNSNQRYVSSSGLEWQGGWELNNPQANIERGESYLRYLRDKFSSNSHRNLLAQPQADDALAAGAAQTQVEIPILKYSK